MAVPKKTTKKTTAKKKAATKSPRKKAPKRAATKKVTLRRPAEPAATEAPAQGDCMCKQKRPNGNFFCFRLVQGRWVQASGIGFPTKEVCEAASCGE